MSKEHVMKDTDRLVSYRLQGTLLPYLLSHQLNFRVDYPGQMAGNGHEVQRLRTCQW